MPTSKLTDALSDWRDEQKKKLPGEPAFAIPSDKIGIVTLQNGATKAIIRADDLLELLIGE